MTIWHRPLNSVSSTVALPRPAGAPLTLHDGTGFGTPTPGAPLIVSVHRGALRLVILECTGRTGNTLTVSGALEGTTDSNLLVGDKVGVYITALALTEIQDGVDAVAAALGTKAADTAVVHTTGNETIAGTKTFSTTIAGNVSGTAATITGAILETQVTGLSSDLAGKAADANVVHTTGDETVAGTKTFSTTIAGNVSGTAGTITGAIAESQVTGLVADLATKAADAAVVHTTGNETIAGTKTFSSTIAGNVSGTAATITGVLSTANLPTTAVTPGAYTNANVTVDTYGRLTAAASGSPGVPGGTSGQVQYNNAGAFGGLPQVWDGSNVLTLTGTAPEQRLTTSGDSQYSRVHRTTYDTVARVNMVSQPAGGVFSLHFDAASSAYADLGTTPLNASGAFSVSFFVKTAATGVEVVLDLLSGPTAMLVYTNPSFFVFGFRGGPQYQCWLPALYDGSWHHVALTYDGSGLFAAAYGLSLDGAGQSIAASGTVGGSTSASAFGRQSAGNYFTGDLRSVTTYDALLSGADITALAGGGSASVTPKHKWTFAEGAGTSIGDSGTPGGVTGTLHSVMFVNQVPGVLIEALVWKSQDGLAAGEGGIQEFGDPAGRTRLNYGTTLDVLHNGTLVLQVGNAGTLNVQQAPGQTDPLQRWLDSTGTPLSYLDTSGVFHGTVAGAGAVLKPAAAGKGLVVEGAAGQTANLVELQDSTGAALAAWDAAGHLGLGATAATGYRLQALGSLKLSGLGTPAAPTVVVNGGSGTTWYYWIAAADATGHYTLVSPSTSASSGATPNCTVSWTALPGAWNYYVLRTTTNTTPNGNVLIDTWTTGALSYVDNNTTATAYTAVTTAGSGGLDCDGALTATGPITTLGTLTGVNASLKGANRAFTNSASVTPLNVNGATSQTAPLLLLQQFSTSTGAQVRNAGVLDAAWATSSDATRKGRLVLAAADASGTNREGCRVESDGSQPLVGFFGVAAVARPVLSYSRAGAGETAAGAALRTALAALGLITDSTT